jgi:hypothetical protein
MSNTIAAEARIQAVSPELSSSGDMFLLSVKERVCEWLATESDWDAAS